MNSSISQKQKVLNFRKKFSSENTTWYSGTLHYLFNGSLLFGSAIFLFLQIKQVTIFELIAIPAMLIIGNLVVYFFHKYPLHQKYKGLRSTTYDQHTLMHHRFYTNEHYLMESNDDFHTLLFPPFAIMIFCGILLPSIYFLARLFLPPNVVFLVLGMSSTYFILYEVVHYTSHLPESHWAMKIGHLKRMRKHHLDHHNPELMEKYNFGIIFPLFDYIFGTKI